MTSSLPYRPALPLEETIKELRKGARLQFDPKLVDAFIRIVEARPSEKGKITQDSPGDKTEQ